MPRAGLSSHDVVAAAAELADEAGFQELTMGLLAQRLGIRRLPLQARHRPGRPQAPHRHPGDGRAGRGGPRRPAGQIRPGRFTALLTAFQAYVVAHPGRYAATTGARFAGPDDPLLAASTRVIDSVAAALRGYGIGDAEMVHAVRTIRSTIHGFAMLQASDGFQWSGEHGDTFNWMIGFIDGGLHGRPSAENAAS